MENYPEKLLFSQQEIASLLKITSGAISQWKLKPVKETSREKLYYLPEVIEYWKSIHSQKKLDLEQERAKLARQQTEKIRLDLAERKRVLIKASEIQKAWIILAGMLRSQILQMSNEMVIALDIVNDHEKRNIVKKIIHKVLAEISQYDPDTYETKEANEDSQDDAAESSQSISTTGGN